jgi:Est1 DNA/RNA binding domain
MKDPTLSMNALYWYCRSLLATHSSFETSNNNLERLFTSNREQLNEYSRGEPPIFVPDKKNPLTTAQKQATTKSCLSHFVDFQFDILQQANEAQLRSKLSGIFKSLESLLEASAFSDQLLFKLVIINAFGMEKAGTEAHRQILVEFMLWLAHTFSVRLTATMAKLLEKPNDPKQLSSIRLLLPLLILMELIARTSDCVPVDKARGFWGEMASVGTLIRRYRLQIDSNDDHAEPEDFQTLKGYRPYNFLKPEYVTSSPFVDENEAVFVLDLQATQTQSSKMDSKNDETKARMIAFVRLCDSCCAQENIPLQFDGKVYQYRPLEPQETSSPAEVVASYRNDASMEADSDDDGGDVVVQLSPPVDSSSTAFALTVNSTTDDTQIRNAVRSKSSGDENQEPPQPKVMPPPGFSFLASAQPGASSEMNHEMAVVMTSSPHVPVLNPSFQWHFDPYRALPVHGDISQQPQPGMPIHNPHIHLPQQMGHQPGAPMYNPGMDLQQQIGQQPGDIFNGIILPTQNPFAHSVPYNLPTHNWSQQPPELYQPMSDMLGSGLLESLFMSEPSSRETKNPFAW